MDKRLVLLPAIALVLLTLIVWCRVFVTRVGEMRRRRIAPQALSSRVRTRELLADVAGPADNFSNLFEVPVLFYTLTVLLYVTGIADRLLLTLAIVFVIARYAHSLIHITYNRVMHRFIAYVIGTLVLWLMWGVFALRLLRGL